jgi:DeoR family transcriptional regulator of aga operon
MIAATRKTIVLADSSKFGKRGFGKICGLENIEQIITDRGISSHTLETLKSMGIEVTIV